MLFETKNGRISILYSRQSHVSINNAEPFQVGSNSAVPQDNPRESRYKFSIRPPFLKPWSKKDPGKATSQLFCHSSNILCFATGSKSRATDCALYTILPKVACLASKSTLSFPAIPTCVGTHIKLTSRTLSVSCQHFCLHSYTNGWVYSEICRDSITLIELILSVKSKYLPSVSLSIWSIAMWIAASSAVKTLVGPLPSSVILQDWPASSLVYLGSPLDMHVG
jgi:hypothetical protein